LAAPDGRGRQVLVEPLLEDHLGGVQMFPRPVCLLVQAAEGRSAIAGQEACRIAPGGLIQASLVDHDPQKRLDPGDEHTALF